MTLVSDTFGDFTIVPAIEGWIALERHLVQSHGVDESAVHSMDTDELRREHQRCHAVGQYRSVERRHTHG